MLDPPAGEEALGAMMKTAIAISRPEYSPSRRAFLATLPIGGLAGTRLIVAATPR
jgi:hypothetical protein